MKYKAFRDLMKEASPSEKIGIYTNLAVSGTATVFGGYEIGTTLNDAYGITNLLARGAVDLATIMCIAKPLETLGLVFVATPVWMACDGVKKVATSTKKGIEHLLHEPRKVSVRINLLGHE